MVPPSALLVLAPEGPIAALYVGARPAPRRAIKGVIHRVFRLEDGVDVEALAQGGADLVVSSRPWDVIVVAPLMVDGALEKRAVSREVEAAGKAG
jgi:hypothetical protein